MRSITGWLYVWCEREMRRINDVGHSKISILYRIWTEGMVSSVRPTSRPLISDYHSSDDALLEAGIMRLPNRQQQCVVLAHCAARRDSGPDKGKEYTRRDYARYLGISKSSFDTHASRGKQALERIIKDLRQKHGRAGG